MKSPAPVRTRYWPPPMSDYDKMQKAEADMRKSKFLDCIAGRDGKTPMNFREALEAVGISRGTMLHWRKDPAFCEAFQAAYDDGMDLVEAEAMRRAVKGVDDPVYYMGKVVGHRRVYSDGLMHSILEARRPELYSRNAGQTVNVQINNEPPSDRELAKALALMVEEAALSKGGEA